MDDLEEITVTSPREKEPYVIPLDSEGKLSLFTLKEYFPYANGLVYSRDGKKTALSIRENHLIINPVVREYEVNIANTGNALTNDAFSSAFSKISDAKREQVLGIRNIMFNGVPESSQKEVVRKLKISDFHETQVSDIRDIQTNIKKNQKSATFQWKHRYKKGLGYVLMTEKHGAGRRVVLLDKNKEYLVKDLIQMALKFFKNSKTEKKFEQSHLVFSLGDKGPEIDSFILPDKTEIGLFDYIDFWNFKLSRLNLYIKTTTKPEFVDALEDLNTTDSIDFESGDESEIFKKPVVPKRVLDKENMELHKKVKKSLQVEMTNKNAGAKEISKLVQLEETQNKSADDNHLMHSKDLVDITIENSLNVVNITYWCLVYSSYGSNELSLQEESKESCYFRILGDEERAPFVDEGNPHNFEPVDFGEQISNISVNGETLFNMGCLENGSKYVNFSEPKDTPAPEHTLLYDIDFVNGYTADGFFGIGVIVKCTEICRPLFTWYCDNQIYKKNFGLHWLSDIPTDKVNSVWHCEVTCNKGCLAISKKVTFINQVPSLINTSEELIEVSINEFTLGDFIDAGSQGRVHKGIFKGEEVAIKVIKVSVANRKFIEKEIAVLRNMNCISFIKLKAVCREGKEVFIITEYFHGSTLAEVLFEQDGLINLKDKNRKYSVAQQICKAFCFLHMQSNAIIHRDIKTENILVNEEGIVKIIDFGLSTFTRAASTIRTTIGNRYLGTFVYMAPELALNKERATIHSDVWAIACVLVEIFTEKPIWNDLEDYEVKKLLKNGTIPDVSNVPEAMKPILLECFSFNVSERPTIFQVLTVLKKNSEVE